MGGKPAQICGSLNSNSKLVTFSGISDRKHESLFLRLSICKPKLGLALNEMLVQLNYVTLGMYQYTEKQVLRPISAKLYNLYIKIFTGFFQHGW